jgi:O-antigen/teichoic acid export membrane protein
LHNAAILEAYTVYGSGKYFQDFREYRKMMLRSNTIACLSLMVLLGLGVAVLLAIAPHLVSKAAVGLVLSVGVLLSAAFLRRTFYILRQPHRATTMSLVFISAVCAGLWLMARMGWLNSFSTFIVFALGWMIAGLAIGRPLIVQQASGNFANLQPDHWEQHWKYARWVLATSFVFQLMTQGYYWLVAGALSVQGVAELRAMHILVTPGDQIFIALSFLVLPRLAYHYASQRRPEFLSLWKRYLLFTCLVTVSLFLAIRALGAPLVHWLYGGKFDNVLSLLYILAAVPIVMGIGNTMNDALKSMEKPHVAFYAYLASGAMTLAAGLPLVRHLGVRGAVIGMLLSAAAYTSLLAVGFFYAAFRQPFGLARAQ